MLEKEYEIEIDEYYTEITFLNRRITLRKGDCYVLGYDEPPDRDDLCVSSDIETIAKFIIEEMKHPNYYWYVISSWENGKRIDGDSFKSR